MIDNIRTTGTGPAYPADLKTHTPAEAAVTPVPDSTLPKSPPAEVLHALDRAQKVIADLAAKNLEIRFAVNDGHVRTQLVDDEGRIVQEIPVRHGLDMLAGQRLFDSKA